MADSSSDRRSAKPNPDEPAATPDVLEAAMRQTLDAYRGAAGQVEESSEMLELRKVARRFPGQKLEAPIVAELTGVVLRKPFAEVVATPADLERLCRNVSQQLWENPDARERLERLWDQLARPA